MDALPMPEETGVDHASQAAGRMHACGHDGHTTMLLGAARYLAETRNFAGSVALIFQPAEEHGEGARAMIADGLFERFPVDGVYAIHNFPSIETGHFAVRAGPIMAAEVASYFSSSSLSSPSRSEKSDSTRCYDSRSRRSTRERATVYAGNSNGCNASWTRRPSTFVTITSR